MTNAPASVPPSKVPGVSGGGSGPFIGLAVVLVLVMGGLLCWKFKGGDAPAPTPSATVAVATSAPVAGGDAPPPPPDDPVPVAEASVAGKKPGAPTGGSGFGCSSTCNGTATAGTRSDISARAGNARGCYERALRVNENLQGRLSVNLRVDTQGNICSSSISNDSVGDGNVASCVLGMFRGARVTPPTGGCVDVSIPLNFQPKGK